LSRTYFQKIQRIATKNPTLHRKNKNHITKLPTDIIFFANEG